MNIKKGYLPYLIGELACFIAEVVLFFLALGTKSIIAIITAVVAVAVSVFAVACVYKKSCVKKAKDGRGIRAAYPLAIISLILLCNPNFGLVDVLPDFIACFILAKLLSVGIDRAPYFAEARRALVRLGWLSVGKIGGLLLVGYSRMQNAFGNDTSVVLITVFAAAELMLGISAITSVFNALFGLGERTDMNATIVKTGRIDPSALPMISCVFFGVKAIMNVVPNLFLLTRVDENGVISTVAKGYSLSIVTSTVLALACGVVWCVIICKYLKSIHKEGQFYSSIFVLSPLDNEKRIERKRECAKIKVSLSLIFAAVVVLWDIKFDNTDGINLLPSFISGILIIIAAARMRKSVSARVMPTVLTGAIYTLVSSVSYLAESFFLYNYGYSALLGEGVAHTVYNAVEITATLELVAFIAMAISLGKLVTAFAYENTAVPPSDERYSRADRDFHRSIKRKIFTLVGMMIAVGVIRCINVYSNGYARLVLNQQATATVMSALPWMGALATAVLVILIGFSYYLFTMLKEELDMKYGGD